MYTGIRNPKANQRNRSTAYFTKRSANNSKTYSRVKVAQEKCKLQLKLTPLCISATSWIVATPNAFKTNDLGGNVNVKGDRKVNFKPQTIKLKKWDINTNLFGMDCNSIMFGNWWSKQREIASLTKIMTCYTVLKIIEKYNLNKHSTLVTVSKRASSEIGTTANLEGGHIFSVWDLLHALMLPSGNDAAIALAEHFGEFLINKDQLETDFSFITNSRLNQSSKYSDWSDYFNREKPPLFPEIKSKNWKDFSSDYTFYESNSNPYDQPCDLKGDTKVNKSFSCVRESLSRSPIKSFPFHHKVEKYFRDSKTISRFIVEMNSNAKMLKMNNTHFDSPHGLANPLNYSTAYDIALLCSVCVQISDFNRIARTRTYVCKNRNNAGLRSLGVNSLLKFDKFAEPSIKSNTIGAKDYKWINTNKLLSKGFVGIKTGVTQTAGPWLATYLKWKKRAYIVVLLNWSSLDQRWIDTYKVIEHCQLKIKWGMINDIKLPREKDVNDQEQYSDSINLSNKNWEQIQNRSLYVSNEREKTDSSFFKNNDMADICDEDGSTTLSSSSPIWSQRKSLV